MLLPQDEKKFFNDFIGHLEGENKRDRNVSRDNRMHISMEERAYAYLILFGEILPSMSRHLTDNICENFRACKDCNQFTSQRCFQFVSNKYDDSDTRKILNKSKYDRRLSDYYFFKKSVRKIKERSSIYSRMCQIVGRYRVELFCHYTQEKADNAFEKTKGYDRCVHETVEQLTKQKFLPTYCTAKYIENNDNWLQFKAIHEEEDFLCSVLSDF